MAHDEYVTVAQAEEQTYPELWGKTGNDLVYLVWDVVDNKLQPVEATFNSEIAYIAALGATAERWYSPTAMPLWRLQEASNSRVSLKRRIADLASEIDQERKLEAVVSLFDIRDLHREAA